MTCRAKLPICASFALSFLTLDLAGCARAPAAVIPSPPVDSLGQLRDDITAATRASGVERAAWGIVVQSLDRGERIFELNARTLLVPASTAKLIALAGAADSVGWDFRYDTRVRGAGPIVDGVLQGDLIVVGAGDPSIGGRGGMDLTPFVEAIRLAGVRRIDGGVIGDDDSLEEPRPQLAWAWDDLGYATGAKTGCRWSSARPLRQVNELRSCSRTHGPGRFKTSRPRELLNRCRCSGRNSVPATRSSR
jgi:D-alanyl-D-alanine carboxypeptidase